MAHLRTHVTAKLEQPCAMIAGDSSGAEDFRRRAGSLGTPDFELKQPVPRGVVALGKEQVVFGFGINMGNAPFVLENFHRPVETVDGESLLGMQHGSAQYQRREYWKQQFLHRYFLRFCSSRSAFSASSARAAGTNT